MACDFNLLSNKRKYFIFDLYAEFKGDDEFEVSTKELSERFSISIGATVETMNTFVRYRMLERWPGVSEFGRGTYVYKFTYEFIDGFNANKLKFISPILKNSDFDSLRKSIHQRFSKEKYLALDKDCRMLLMIFMLNKNIHSVVDNMTVADVIQLFGRVSENRVLLMTKQLEKCGFIIAIRMRSASFFLDKNYYILLGSGVSHLYINRKECKWGFGGAAKLASKLSLSLDKGSFGALFFNIPDYDFFSIDGSSSLNRFNGGDENVSILALMQIKLDRIVSKLLTHYWKELERLPISDPDTKSDEAKTPDSEGLLNLTLSLKEMVCSILRSEQVSRYALQANTFASLKDFRVIQKQLNGESVDLKINSLIAEGLSLLARNKQEKKDFRKKHSESRELYQLAFVKYYFILIAIEVARSWVNILKSNTFNGHEYIHSITSQPVPSVLRVRKTGSMEYLSQLVSRPNSSSHREQYAHAITLRKKTDTEGNVKLIQEYQRAKIEP